MSIAFSRTLAVLILSGMAAGCMDQADVPVLTPVGYPVNPSPVADAICLLDGNAMYGEAMRQYRLRSRMIGNGDGDQAEAHAIANAAGNRQYTACMSAQGYRASFPQAAR